MNLEPGEARLVDWTAAEYFAADQFMSRSQLSDLPDNPAVFAAKERGEMATKVTKQMQFGTYVHLALLEPTEWERRLFDPEPAKPVGARGNAKKKDPEGFKLWVQWKTELSEWEARVEGSPDAIVLDADERNEVDACVEALRTHYDPDPGVLCIADLFEAEGLNEQTVIWRCPDPDVLIRVRIDRLVFLDPGTVVVFDAKATFDPSPRAFGLSIARLGLDRQAAMYTDAVSAAFPDKAVHFVFGPVRSRPPYEAALYELEGAEYETGRRKYTNALREYVRRRDANDWLAPWQRGINKAEMPEWAHKEETT